MGYLVPAPQADPRMDKGSTEFLASEWVGRSTSSCWNSNVFKRAPRIRKGCPVHPSQSCFPLKQTFSSALAAAGRSDSPKAALLLQKMIYSAKLMIWNDRLALVKNQFLLFGKGLDKVSLSLSGPQTAIPNYPFPRTKLHLDCGAGTFTSFFLSLVPKA